MSEIQAFKRSVAGYAQREWNTSRYNAVRETRSTLSSLGFQFRIQESKSKESIGGLSIMVDNYDVIITYRPLKYRGRIPEVVINDIFERWDNIALDKIADKMNEAMYEYNKIALAGFRLYRECD